MSYREELANIIRGSHHRVYDFIVMGDDNYKKAFDCAAIFYSKLNNSEKNQISFVKIEFKFFNVFDHICIELKNVFTKKVIHFMFYPHKTIVKAFNSSEFGYDTVCKEQYILN